MIRKLRSKFILINMLLAVLVLAATFGGVCYMSYSSSLISVYSQLNAVLARVASSMIPQIEEVRSITTEDVEAIEESMERLTDDSAFYFPELADDSAGSDVGSNTESDATSGTSAGASSGAESNAAGNAAGNTANGTASDTASASAQSSVGAYIYEQQKLTAPDDGSSASKNDIVAAPNIGNSSAEFFDAGHVTLYAVYAVNDQGIYTTITNFSIASINEGILLRANDIVLKSNEDIGYLPELGLCYERMPAKNGYIVAYADASRVNNWKELALMLTLVGVIALAIFYLINIAFSQWALRPVRQSILQQREMLKQQQQFTADASHELKTPLTVILANMSILKSHPESTVAEEIQWIESTQTEAERMQLLVNDMLDLARPKDDRVTQNGALAGKDSSDSKTLQERGWIDVDFSDLVEGEALQFESVAFDRGIIIKSRINEDLHVQGNPERLGRMVSTLIDNACKYAEENGEVTVRLFSRPARNGRRGVSSGDSAAQVAKLTVHNSGTPISQEDLPHLFDRFYRADKARTSGKGGYGLGLAIGREIAREHGGDITVRSSEADGTTFIVTIPLLSEGASS